MSPFVWKCTETTKLVNILPKIVYSTKTHWSILSLCSGFGTRDVSIIHVSSEDKVADILSRAQYVSILQLSLRASVRKAIGLGSSLKFF